MRRGSHQPSPPETCGASVVAAPLLCGTRRAAWLILRCWGRPGWPSRPGSSETLWVQRRRIAHVQSLPHGPLLHIPTVCSASHTPLPKPPHHSCVAPAAAQRRPAPTHALPPTPLCRFVCTEWGGRRQRRSLLSTGAGWWPTPAAVASRHRTLSRPQPRSAVAAWPSSAPCCRSTPAPAQLFLGGGASRWRPGSRGHSAASPLFSTHARLTLAGFGLSLSLSNTSGDWLRRILRWKRPAAALQEPSCACVQSRCLRLMQCAVPVW